MNEPSARAQPQQPASLEQRVAMNQRPLVPVEAPTREGEDITFSLVFPPTRPSPPQAASGDDYRIVFSEQNPPSPKAETPCVYPPITNYTITLSYQRSRTLLRRLAERVNDKVKLQDYIATAPQITLDRPEDIFTVMYEKARKDNRLFRVYGGFFPPIERVLYTTSGQGTYPVREGGDPVDIGNVDLAIRERGWIYTIGGEYLLASPWDRVPCLGLPVRLLAGPGIALLGFHGSLTADFDAAATPNENPDRRIVGEYKGGAGEAHGVVGIRTTSKNGVNLTLFAGYRVGGGYTFLDSDIKDGNSAFWLADQFFRVELGAPF